MTDAPTDDEIDVVIDIRVDDAHPDEAIVAPSVVVHEAADDALIVEAVPVEAVPVEEVLVERTPTERPRVDPRIRARRIAVAREQGRRRLRVVLVLLGAVVVAGSAFLVVNSPFADVDHIVVTGVPANRVAAIVAASGVHRHDPMLLVSTRAIAHRVERVPGIGSVHVTRDFPGTVRISVRLLGVALWARVPAGGVALVGHDGRILRYASAPPPGGIELRGEKQVPAPGGQIVRAAVVGVIAQLPEPLAVRVGAMSATAPDDVRLYLVTGGEVRLGDLSSVHDKAVAAEAVIERMGCQLVYVDVRSLSNPVALPAPGASCN